MTYRTICLADVEKLYGGLLCSYNSKGASNNVTCTGKCTCHGCVNSEKKKKKEKRKNKKLKERKQKFIISDEALDKEDDYASDNEEDLFSVPCIMFLVCLIKF